jgi:hypothetical protein
LYPIRQDFSSRTANEPPNGGNEDRVDPPGGWLNRLDDDNLAL